MGEEEIGRKGIISNKVIGKFLTARPHDPKTARQKLYLMSNSEKSKTPVGRQLKPEFPLKVLDDLNGKSILPASMIDVTEGLASDLLQICKSSGVGCRIFSSKIPVDAETAKLAEEFRIDPVIPSLNGGEDYELLFTAPLESFEKIKSVESVKVIGHITTADHSSYLVGEDGSEVEIMAQGWRH